MVKKKKKPVSKSKVVKELDRVFSLYIRHRDNYTCATCGKQSPEQAQCGHYVSRANMNTRWDEINCNCQCVGCNVFKSGNMDEYALFMVSKYGENILKELKEKKNTIRQWTIKELQEKIAEYKIKLS
jgi:5-methylcytosine-specific restriction endonuclease McrA